MPVVRWAVTGALVFVVFVLMETGQSGVGRNEMCGDGMGVSEFG